MKLLKKLIIISSIIVALGLTMISSMNPIYATNTEDELAIMARGTESTFRFEIRSQSIKAKRGETVTIVASVKDFSEVEDGIYILGGNINYDQNTLELVAVEGLSRWNFEMADFNTESHTFIATSDVKVSAEEEVFKMHFKVKDNAEFGRTTIKAENIEAGEFAETIYARNTSTFNLTIEEGEIRSGVYNIDDTNKIISNINIETKVSDFRNCIETNYKSIRFLNQNGEQLGENNFIGTGMTIVTEDNTVYTIIVTEDIDGDGVIGINDIAKLKLHYIKKVLLTGINLVAADADKNGYVAINDIAMIRLHYIQKR